MTLSESCRFGFTRRSWIWSQMGFLGSSKHLYQLLSWGLRCTSSFSTRICENFLSERLMVFSFLRLRFGRFRILFTGSHRLVYQMFSCVGKWKISFSMRICERTCTEKTFRSPAIKVGLFSNAVFGYEHFWEFFKEIFRQFRRSKTVFSKWMWEGRTFFKKEVFDIAQWTFNCFPIWYSVTLTTSIKNLVILEKWKYRFSSGFAKEQLFQKVVLFSDLLDELCFLFKCGFEIFELSSFIVS